MGQMLYAHIEYQIQRDGRTRYNCFAECYIERCYDLFALMGGREGRREDSLEPPFPLRGVPDNLCSFTFMAWLLRVMDEATDRERSIARPDALRWVEEGLSRFVGEHHITDPDFHSPSWMTAAELAEVYGKYLAHHREAPERRLPTLEAILAAMRQLSEARLVYWFDN